ncbi:hypothetical protein FACS18942_02500 [Planctomycetales bacterium]|nr:hypothetical protein FACS18942_02500 [Planctomycetales bacterium]
MAAVFQSSNLQVDITSLIGRLSLKQTQSGIKSSVRNLSTGLRIHTGKDDPTGFIASSSMQTDITSMNQAVAGSQRTNSLLSVTDNTLAQMNSLLIDLRGLITQAANTGAETAETLASLQMQADAILDSFDYLANSTEFQDKKLIDGSLDFTTYGVQSQKILDYTINQANFLGRTEKDVSVQVLEPPKQGELYYPYGALKNDITIGVGGTGGTQSFNFSKGASVQDIADAVNRFSDATGVAASVYSRPTAGALGITSYGENNDVILTASQTGRKAGNYIIRYTAPKTGNDELSLNVSPGTGNEPTLLEVVLKTATGGNVLTTANDIVSLLNTSPLLKDSSGNALLTARTPSDQSGTGIVTPFCESAYYGSADESNLLQFLGPKNSPKISFVSEPNTPLSVDYATDPPVYAKSAAVIQGLDAGTSFTLRAKNPGTEYDNVEVIFSDSTSEGVKFDPQQNAVIFSVDFTGRAADPQRQPFSMNDLRRWVADESTVSSMFSVEPLSDYPPDQPPLFTNSGYNGINESFGKTNGGLVSAGTLLVHLETDYDGNVKTTANDLVRFFNNPSTEEAAELLRQLGISAANVDPGNSNLNICTSGSSPNGIGLLKPTYNPLDPNCTDTTGMLPEIVFGTYNANTSPEFPAALITASNGANALFQIAAKRTDEQYNDTSVYITSDDNGPSVSYDAQSKQLIIGIDPLHPSTANDIVALINSDTEVSQFFEASIPVKVPGMDRPPTGDGFVHIGDGGILKYADNNTAYGTALFGASDGEALGLTFHSVEYGSAEFVSITLPPNTDFPLTDRSGNAAEKAYGTDIIAKIDNKLATGKGRAASLSTSDLDLSLWIDANVRSGDVFGFRIDGGGAIVQLGQNPVSTQQARIGIQSMNTVSLGGIGGLLAQLRNGREYSLLNDTNRAYQIVENVTAEVTSLRGRLGAFQRYQLQANIDNMIDAIEVETEAMSSIKDADFAAEASNQSRLQMLMQANISALSQNRQSMQMLLGLLQ